MPQHSISHWNRNRFQNPRYLCQQVQEIANGLSANAEYVDWRRFLIAIAQPLPSPTQTELLETLQRFKEMDQKSTGCVTREQYDRVSSQSKINMKSVIFVVYGIHFCNLNYCAIFNFFSYCFLSKSLSNLK